MPGDQETSSRSEVKGPCPIRKCRSRKDGGLSRACEGEKRGCPEGPGSLTLGGVYCVTWGKEGSRARRAPADGHRRRTAVARSFQAAAVTVGGRPISGPETAFLRTHGRTDARAAQRRPRRGTP